uniref:Uncharacterized protein n=1 Tax=Anguilla anguilla TaxID=7936 RepID=A0A0E9SJ06_ANGAN
MKRIITTECAYTSYHTRTYCTQDLNFSVHLLHVIEVIQKMYACTVCVCYCFINETQDSYHYI